MRRARALPALLLGLLGACAGYELMDPDAGGGRTIAVPPARNESAWLGLEAPLTRALRADLQRLLAVRTDSAAPDLVLQAALVDPERRGRVGLRGGAYALGSVFVQVEWSLTGRDGALLASGLEARELEFVPSVEETERGTYEQVFRSVSEKIVLDVAAALDAAEAGGSRSSR
jgi:hypothetical protein